MDRKFCPHCGAELQEGQAHCTKCGELVVADTKSDRKNSLIKKVLIIVGISIAAAVILTFVILMIVKFAKTGSWSLDIFG